MNKRTAVGITWISVAMALLATSGAARSDSVGAAAAVHPSSTGTPPGGNAETLEVGSDIVSKERIRTTLCPGSCLRRRAMAAGRRRWTTTSG